MRIITNESKTFAHNLKFKKRRLDSLKKNLVKRVIGVIIIIRDKSVVKYKIKIESKNSSTKTW